MIRHRLRRSSLIAQHSVLFSPSRYTGYPALERENNARLRAKSLALYSERVVASAIDRRRQDIATSFFQN